MSMARRLQYDRKLSFVAQLSDPNDYEGGEFEFDKSIPVIPQDVLKKKGTVIVFPSYVYHRVNKVTAGERFSLVAWAEGPRFR